MSFKSIDDNLKAVEATKSNLNNLGIKTKSVDTDVKSGKSSYSNTSYKSKRQVCFTLFDKGKTPREILNETGYSSALIAQYYQQWKKERNIKANNKAIEDKDKEKDKGNVKVDKAPMKSCEKENPLDSFVDKLFSDAEKEKKEKKPSELSNVKENSIDAFVDKIFSDIEPKKEDIENNSKGVTKTNIKNKSNVTNNKKEAEEVMTKEEKTSIKVADNEAIVKDKTKSKIKSNVEKQDEEVVKLIPHQLLATYNLNGITGVIKNNEKVAIDLGLDKYLTKEELIQLIKNLKSLEKELK